MFFEIDINHMLTEFEFGAEIINVKGFCKNPIMLVLNMFLASSVI